MFFGLIINNMNNLIIREGRVLLEQQIDKQQTLKLKLGVGSKIYKFEHLEWNSFCRRWEINQEIRLTWTHGDDIQLELYYQCEGPLTVVGEGQIDMAVFSQHFNQEIKVVLTYEGIMTGWLYCKLGLEGAGGQEQIQNKFLCIYKINFSFMEEEDQSFRVQIFQNTLSIFEKQFNVVHKVKTIFPNLKQPIHYSDVISLSICHTKKQFKTISFLVDNIKRGKTTYFESWIRNNHNNRTGDLKLEYFLENLFLENERKMVSRKGLYHAAYSIEDNPIKISDNKNQEESTSKTSSKKRLTHKNKDENDQQNNKLVRNKKNDEKQKSRKLKPPFESKRQRTSIECHPEQLKKNENSLSSPSQTKTQFTISKSKIQKLEKKPFYFQNPLE